MLSSALQHIDRSIGYTVREIATPKAQLLCWRMDESTRAEIAGQAAELGITYLPVMDNGRIIGVIGCEALAAGEPYVPLTSDWLIAVDTPILHLIELFARSENHAYFVLQSSEVVGVVAPADLNKIPARASLYLLVAHFEAELLNLVKRVLGEDESALEPFLSSDRINRLRDERDKAKKRDMTLGLLHYAYLNDLVNIAYKNDSIRIALGYKTATEAREHLSFTHIRNQVSHLTGLLVASREELVSINDCCERLIDASRRITAASL